MTRPLNWQEFLQAAKLPESATCLRAINPQHALIKVTGSDAENFLHAQLSNSVTGMIGGEVRFAAWCNAKGRVWTLLRYWKDNNAIILRMPADQVEATLKRLRMFVLRSDVHLEPLDLKASQFLGPDAEAQASESSDNNGYTISLPGAWPLQEAWSSETINSDLPDIPHDFIALPRILAGIPEVFANQREAWIPQMLNLDKLNGIDFKKGCYPGQEIVAKLHYKGGLKQRLIIARLDNTPNCPEASDTLIDATGGKVATVIEMARTQSTCWLLAVARLESLNAPIFYGDNAIHIIETE